MDKKFLISRQGKDFALYAGILDLAHNQGLQTITTELIQVPSEANNRVAICKATVTLEKEGVTRLFTGIGDAAPNNVAPAMQTCLIRMAETRAKGRALRDAVNIGVAVFEELDDEDAVDHGAESGYTGQRKPQRPQAPAARPQAPTRTVQNAAAARSQAPAQGADGVITDVQAGVIERLCEKSGLDPDAVAAEHFGRPLSKVSSSQAGQLISKLQK